MLIVTYTSFNHDDGEWRDALFHRRWIWARETHFTASWVRRSAAARRVGAGRLAPTVPRAAATRALPDPSFMTYQRTRLILRCSAWKAVFGTLTLWGGGTARSERFPRTKLGRARLWGRGCRDTEQPQMGSGSSPARWRVHRGGRLGSRSQGVTT